MDIESIRWGLTSSAWSKGIAAQGRQRSGGRRGGRDLEGTRVGRQRYRQRCRTQMQPIRSMKFVRAGTVEDGTDKGHRTTKIASQAKWFTKQQISAIM